MTVCPSCGQSLPSGDSAPLSPAELAALSAWWHTGTVRKAAALLSRSERTIVNQLYSARIRNDVHTTLELVQLHLDSLRSLPDLLASHNVARGKVA